LDFIQEVGTLVLDTLLAEKPCPRKPIIMHDNAENVVKSKIIIIEKPWSLSL